MRLPLTFNRMEFAGSLGDLGTVLPLAIGMILVNGLDPSGLFLSVGLLYIFTGLYFGITTPVEPMKVIGAYAIATAMSPQQIMASGILMGTCLLVIGATGAIALIGKYTPKAVIRGVQLSTGTLLMAEGIKFMIGKTKLQVLHQIAEPYLAVQQIGPIPVGLVIGIIGAVLTLLLLENKRMPAGLMIVATGILIGLLMGTRQGLGDIRPGLYLPRILPLGFPEGPDFTFALLALVLPQMPMTIGNAVIAEMDLSISYFGTAARRVTGRALCVSMALGNFLSALLGGMPLCHGAGGLAAHYRFGARSAGSNLIIGAIFILLTLLLGNHILALFNLIPMAILGVLLLFSGSQLALTVLDIKERKEMFVVVTILGITLASNLAAGFIVGIAIAYLLRSQKFTV
ncbi:putative sulfate/molybdate transporter [Desulfosarcina sp.]|uniref:putative sulfate/molybdate transporter n=1 Tax=Desulfosarcina sp. TaxID=2027861 RepID=UPI0029BDEFEE|nr:putative sulfate/molybdate transporter [Desulfosarcina sp.]MDX2455441.1 putative sulfate/molybdate transporter [Desulfosarcina sp.]MDX2492939.1 putative sulfate/molybdate transporter [Desulfosarcina sp.]